MCCLKSLVIIGLFASCAACSPIFRFELVSATPDAELQAWRTATDDWMRKGSAALQEHEQRLDALEQQQPAPHLTTQKLTTKE